MKILYFGPIAESGKPALGGFEAANRKNIDKLRQLRIDVEEFSNPIINRKWGKLGKLAYISLYFKPFILAKYIGRKNVLIHATPLVWQAVVPLSLFIENSSDM